MDEVKLRDVTDEDLPIFFEHQQDPEACQMAGFQSRDWEPFLDHWSKILADQGTIKQTILHNDQVAGNIVCYGPPDGREVGYWIGRKFWGRGIATRALLDFLHIVRERPLHARAVRHNIASLRVLLKCGFLITGEEGEEILLQRIEEDHPEEPLT